MAQLFTKFQKEDWSVLEFFPYEKFSELWAYQSCTTIGPEEEELQRYLIENAKSHGIKGHRDNKTAFKVQCGNRVMVWAFYDNGLFIIPISG